MALPESGKITHKDIMTEFEHPRDDFKLSGDGAPILQRATNAQVKESDFYGLKKGGDMGGAAFGQALVANGYDDLYSTQDGFTWTKTHPSVGAHFASGGERMMRSYINSSPRGRMNTSIFAESTPWVGTQSANRNFGPKGGGTHGAYESFWEYYGGNYAGPSARVDKPDDVTDTSSGSTWTSLSFDGCCPSYSGSCYPSPCKSNGQLAGKIMYIPNARAYIGLGLRTYSNTPPVGSAFPYKTSTSGTGWNYPKGGNTVANLRSNGAGDTVAATWSCNNVAIATTRAGAYNIFRAAAAFDKSGVNEHIQHIKDMAFFKGKWYYAWDQPLTRAGGKRVAYSNTFPPNAITGVGPDYAAPTYSRAGGKFLLSPDENALIHIGKNDQTQYVVHTTTNGTTWQKTLTLQLSTGRIAAQLWHPFDAPI